MWGSVCWSVNGRPCEEGCEATTVEQSSCTSRLCSPRSLSAERERNEKREREAGVLGEAKEDML